MSRPHGTSHRPVLRWHLAGEGHSGLLRARHPWAPLCPERRPLSRSQCPEEPPGDLAWQVIFGAVNDSVCLSDDLSHSTVPTRPWPARAQRPSPPVGGAASRTRPGDGGWDAGWLGRSRSAGPAGVLGEVTMWEAAPRGAGRVRRLARPGVRAGGQGSVSAGRAAACAPRACQPLPRHLRENTLGVLLAKSRFSP